MTPKEYKQQLLDNLYKTYTKDMPCHLDFCGRTNIVFGEGNADACLMLIGEAPGEEEDKQGRPFVGRSGQLLNRALSKAEIDRNEVYITNVIKCRPPNNRMPLPHEIKKCTERFLYNQIKIIRPKVIATLGAVASTAILEEPIKITKIHGSVLKKDGISIIPIYHPAYILRNRNEAQNWLNDLIAIRELCKE